MLKFFKRRRPAHRADERPPVAEVLVMSAWGLSEVQWASMTDFERSECRRNITAAPKVPGMIAATPLTGLLRLAEGIPRTAENFRGLGELIQGLTNYINALEKDDDE